MERKGKKKKVENTPKVQGIMNANFAPETDPLGSYTGKPVDKNEVPVQDADDL